MTRSALSVFAVLSIFVAVGCESTATSQPSTPKGETAAATQEEGAAAPVKKRAQSPAAERDERQSDGNFLELLQRKQEENDALRRRITELEDALKESQTAAANAKEGETRATADAERLQGLLQDTVARERAAEDRFLKARLDAVRAEKELYRQKIAAIGQAEEK